MTAPLVIFDKVQKHFGDFVAVKELDFEIREGEFLAIMGPSGCGKTTTLRMLAGLDASTSGEIRLGGKVMNDVAPHERDTPLVWQSLALFPFLTARENVEFGLKMRGVGKVERKERALKWLDKMQILEFADRDISTLSGGQKQRVALARSLVMEPQILLLAIGSWQIRWTQCSCAVWIGTPCSTATPKARKFHNLSPQTSTRCSSSLRATMISIQPALNATSRSQMNQARPPSSC